MAQKSDEPQIQIDQGQHSSKNVSESISLKDALTDVTLVNPEFHQALSLSNMVAEQKIDPFIISIREALADPSKTKKQHTPFLIENDIVKRYWFNKGSQKLILQTVLPKSLVPYALHQFHGATISGHFGIEKVTGTILLRFWWPTIGTDVHEWVRSCSVCQLTKRERTPNVPLISIPVNAPWELVAVDCLQIKPSRSGNTNVVVFCDYFTKWVEAFPTADIKAETIANLFIDKVVLRHGEPKYLLSDQGSNFTSKLMADVCAILKSKKLQTTPYHPQCDGLVERFNKTLLEQLARLSIDDPEEWEKYLPYALFAYRATPHDTTKETPFFLMHGRQPRFQIDNIVARKLTFPLEYDSYRFFLGSTLLETQKIVLENVKKAQEKQKRYYDQKTKEKDFKVGDLVALRTCSKFKLDKKYVGPFKVFNVPTPSTVDLVDLTDPERIVKVSLARVKFWYESNLRSQFEMQ
jgi:hypothetical protein